MFSRKCSLTLKTPWRSALRSHVICRFNRLRFG